MNTREKGNKAEREYEKMLKMSGYITDRRRGSTYQATDYFGVADIIAMNDKEWLLVQVKSNSTGGAIAMYKRFLSTHRLPPNTRCIVAVRKDGRGGKKVEWKEHEVSL